ncbi:MAG: class I SAM-dependent methyltransferase [Patescibacteria group bacterium]|jgi:hypothetical protein
MHKESSSFRDPSGVLFWNEGILYREVHHSYKDAYRQFMDGGLYTALIDKALLLPHEEVDAVPLQTEKSYQVIRPEFLSFISYPYEWSFGMLQDAALLTLDIQRIALAHNMTLKDASAFNIQFRAGKPILIDSLSFEPYTDGRPWVAYRQFCEHFLAPLALMAYSDVRLSGLTRLYLGGVPLDLASTLLPQRTKLNFGLLSHIHLHARTQSRYADRAENQRTRTMPKRNLEALLENLRKTISSLSWEPGGTEWADYYGATNYTDHAFTAKEQLVHDAIKEVHPESVWDLGANTGVFAQLAAQQGIPTIAFDIDPAAVEKGYRAIREKGEKNILPLVMDFTNPSPSLGWAHAERRSLLSRGPADLSLALALVHHLAIGNNVPLSELAAFFVQTGKHLVIEFVPKEDSRVQKLLATREDVFPEYTQECFERVFEEYFVTLRKETIPESKRILYLMARKRS